MTKRTFKCFHCSERFSDQGDMALHLVNNTDMTGCYDCMRVFAFAETISRLMFTTIYRSKIEKVLAELEHKVKGYKTVQDEYTNGQIRILRRVLRLR